MSYHLQDKVVSYYDKDPEVDMESADGWCDCIMAAGSHGLYCKQLTKQITFQRAGEDGLKSLRIMHQLRLLVIYVARRWGPFFFLCIPKWAQLVRFTTTFGELWDETSSCHLFMKAATVESAIQALPIPRPLYFFLFVCMVSVWRRELGCIRNSSSTCSGSLTKKKWWQNICCPPCLPPFIASHCSLRCYLFSFCSPSVAWEANIGGCLTL